MDKKLIAAELGLQEDGSGGVGNRDRVGSATLRETVPELLDHIELKRIGREVRVCEEQSDGLQRSFTSNADTSVRNVGAVAFATFSNVTRISSLRLASLVAARPKKSPQTRRRGDRRLASGLGASRRGNGQRGKRFY